MIIIVEEILRYFNDTNRVDNEHSTLYLNIAQVGAFDTYYGAGHLKILSEFVRNYSKMELVGVDKYL